MRKIFRSLIYADTIDLNTIIATQTQTAVKINILTYNVSSDWNFVFDSSRDLRCNFQHEDNRPEHYDGKISKFNVDINYKSNGVMI